MKMITDFKGLDDFVRTYQAYIFEQSNKLQWLHAHRLDVGSFIKAFGSAQPKDRDPFSREYFEWEMAFFKFLSGRDYDFHNEGLALKQCGGVPQSELALAYKMTLYRNYADILEFVSPGPGRRILEMGCGKGYLLELLGRCGCEVWAFEACKDFAESAAQLLSGQNIKNRITAGSFYEIENCPELFDSIIFAASFHHCAEPFRLLSALRPRLKPGGKVYLIQEPISPDFDRPWGLVRYEGETMLQIRMRGWMELGFRTDFFEELLGKTRFKVVNTRPIHDASLAYEIMKIEEVPNIVGLMQDKVTSLNNELEAMRCSKSWRLTKPLRWLNGKVKIMASMVKK